MRTFNGTTDFARLLPPLTSPPLTLSCWVLPNSIGPSRSIMGLYLGASRASPRFFELQQNGTALEARQGGPGGTVSAVRTGAFTAGVWTHVCGTFAGADRQPVVKLAYAGGVSGGSMNGYWYPAALDRFTLGAYDLDPGFGFFDGVIAEAAVWNVALAAADVALLAAGACPREVQPGNLVW